MKAQLENSQKEVTTGVRGVTSGQKGSKRAKRAKKAFLDHIIDQKRLIKGFRLKIGKQNETTTQIQPGKSHHRGSRGHKWPERVKKGKKGQTGLFGPY